MKRHQQHHIKAFFCCNKICFEKLCRDNLSFLLNILGNKRERMGWDTQSCNYLHTFISIWSRACFSNWPGSNFTNHFYDFGYEKVIRGHSYNTWNFQGEGGYGTVSPQMPQGEGVGEVLAKVLRAIFSKIMNHIFVFWPVFLSERKRLILWKIKMSHHTVGKVCANFSNWHMRKGGSQIGQKSVTSRIIWMAPHMHAFQVNFLATLCKAFVHLAVLAKP